jgi:hypothetical protein
MMKKRNLGFFYSLILLFLVSCSFQRKLTLEGYIYEAYSKSPLPGITIKANGTSVISDQDGFYKIQEIPQKKVPVVIGNHKNYSDLEDILLLDERINHRDFILYAKHPLGIDLNGYIEPSSYVFTFHTTKGNEIPTSIYSGESIPIDEKIKLLGKFYDSSKQWKSLEVIQIGLSFFEKDEYNNWNEPVQPNIQALQFQSDAGDMIKKAYHFFEDPSLIYTEETNIVVIEGSNTKLFHVSSSTKENTARQYDVYLIVDGANKGQAKKIVRTISLPGSKTKDTLLLNQWNQDLLIQAPQITQ